MFNVVDYRLLVLLLLPIVSNAFQPPRSCKRRACPLFSVNQSPSLLMDKLDSLLQHDDLPIYDIIPNLLESTSTNVILEAPPGAGKTTVVPLAMLHQVLDEKKKIWVVEPRRVAARSAATRMAGLLGEPVGETVGYVIRGERKVSGKTRITVVTDGILLQRLRNDVDFSDISIVIFDEFHERGVDSDVALALCRETQRLLRNSEEDDPLQLIVMSATLLGNTASESSSATKLVQALGGDECSVLQSDGRQYPIEILHINDLKWDTRPLPLSVLMKDRKGLVDIMACAIEQGFVRAPGKGDILGFLPGAAEIRQTINKLEQRGNLPKDVEVVPLYGVLSKEQQDYALFPKKHSPRRVIVSTPIAEASLTLARVTCVVDSGLQREPRCDVDTNMPRLVTSRCSRASATQRAGRAGRVQEGMCIRIFSESEFNDLFEEHAAPEIVSTDLSQTVLLLVDWGCSSIQEILHDMPFVDPPPRESSNTAVRLLVDLDAIEQEGDRISMTHQGRQISKIPTHPRFATNIVRAANESPLSLAGAVAATYLLDDDIGSRSPTGPDLASRVCAIYQSNSGAQARALLQYAARIGKDARESVENVLDGKLSVQDVAKALGAALLPGFVDLVAERKGDASYGGSTYLLSLGRSARLDGIRDAPEYVVVLDTSTSDDGKTRIRAFVGLDKETLLGAAVEKNVVFTVPSRGHEVRARKVRMVGSLELESTPLPSPPADEVADILKQTVRSLGGCYTALVQSAPPAKRAEIGELRNRVRLASKLSENSAVPWAPCFAALDRQANGTSTKEDDLILEEGIEPWLAAAGSLKKLDFCTILSGSLTPEQKWQLKSEFPTRIEAPDGTHVPVSYSTDPPSASAKLQQFFGTAESPSVGPYKNRIAISLSLLSPGGKMIAQTVDLPFFWAETYPAVRAEMRGRYAKHPWPEVPMSATATRQTKKQLGSAYSSSEEKVARPKKKRRKKK